MSSALLEKLLSNNSQLNDLQKDKIQETINYLEKHKIALLFEEVLSQVIFDMSNQPRKAILDALMNYKRQSFFDVSDFEVIFDQFDPFETKTVKLHCVVQGLKIIGIDVSDHYIQEQYQNQFKEGKVYKYQFIEILKAEYQKR